MAFDPALQPFWIALLALGGAALITFLYWRDRPSLLRRSAVRLAVLRTVLLGLLLVFLLNPYVVRSSADRRAYEVIVLADVSGSMLTEDAGRAANQSRLQAAGELMFGETGDAAPGLLDRLREHHQLRVYQFADETQPLANPAADSRGLDYSSGGTAIGDALARSRDLVLPGNRLGAVLLLSDGISNVGRPVIDALQPLRESGVPVHAVGIGSRGDTGDRFVRLRDRSVRADRGGVAVLDLEVGHTFDATEEITLEVFDGPTRIATETIEVAPGAVVVHQMQIPAPEARQSSISVRATGRQADANAANDADFATITLTDPPRLTVLHISDRPAWESRLLRQLYSDSETVEFRRLIQLSPERFLADSTSESFIPPEQPSFPETADFWYDCNAIILECSVMPKLNEAARQGLEGFVADRGGGLLFVGDAEALKNDDGGFPSLFPARAVNSHLTHDVARMIDISTVPVFVDQASGPLFNPPYPTIPDDSVFRSAADLKRGARSVAETGEGRLPVLTLQAFGAGRSGFLGLDRTWNWRLGSERGFDQHTEFWNGLVSWLSLGGKPRVSPEVDASVVSADQTAELGVRVLGPDYLPTSEALASVVVQSESGERRSLSLTASVTEPGRYDLEVNDLPPGFYTAEYTIQMPEGETIETAARFTVVPSLSEQGDTIFREALLRDVARLTGGRYWSTDEAAQLRQLPVSSEVPLLQEPVYWARAWPLLFLALTLAGSEWYLRRREGLN